MMTSEQIQLYEPDIILTGGWGLVSNILHRYLRMTPSGSSPMDRQRYGIIRVIQSVRKKKRSL